MWLFAGEDVISNSEIQQPAPLWPLVQGGVNPSVTIADGWSSCGTSCAMLRLEVSLAGEPSGDVAGTEIGYVKDRRSAGVKQE